MNGKYGADQRCFFLHAEANNNNNLDFTISQKKLME
jgi:hypothetical protein